MTSLAMVTGGLLMAVGFWGILTRRNLIRIIISLAIAETGLQLVMIAVGYVRGGTAPILNEAARGATFVDPVPQALVLTAIVIGVAVNALLLALIIKMYRKKGTLRVEDFKELRW
jgi:multisubunit Na+/H+ antiporter MnhC subunit